MTHPYDPERSLKDPRLGIGSRHSADILSDWATAPDTSTDPDSEKPSIPEVDVRETLRRLADPALKDLIDPSSEVVEHALLFRTGRRSTGNFKTRRSHRAPKHL